MINPTGGRIRADSLGDGSFGTPRGHRLHNGEDYLVTPGSEVKAVISGYLTRVVYPYTGDTHWKGIEIKNDNFICHQYYLEPAPEVLGKYVKQGEIIGFAQDISQKYGDEMQPHIHVQIWVRPSLFM